LGKVPTFLPNIGIGAITNKFGESMSNKFSTLELPKIRNMLPPSLDYDTLDLVVENENAENGNENENAENGNENENAENGNENEKIKKTVTILNAGITVPIAT